MTTEERQVRALVQVMGGSVTANDSGLGASLVLPSTQWMALGNAQLFRSIDRMSGTWESLLQDLLAGKRGEPSLYYQFG